MTYRGMERLDLIEQNGFEKHAGVKFEKPASPRTDQGQNLKAHMPWPVTKAGERSTLVAKPPSAQQHDLSLNPYKKLHLANDAAHTTATNHSDLSTRLFTLNAAKRLRDEEFTTQDAQEDDVGDTATVQGPPTKRFLLHAPTATAAAAPFHSTWQGSSYNEDEGEDEEVVSKPPIKPTTNTLAGLVSHYAPPPPPSTMSAGNNRGVHVPTATPPPQYLAAPQHQHSQLPASTGLHGPPAVHPVLLLPPAAHVNNNTSNTMQLPSVGHPFAVGFPLPATMPLAPLLLAAAASTPINPSFHQHQQQHQQPFQSYEQQVAHHLPSVPLLASSSPPFPQAPTNKFFSLPPAAALFEQQQQQQQVVEERVLEPISMAISPGFGGYHGYSSDEYEEGDDDDVVFEGPLERFPLPGEWDFEE